MAFSIYKLELSDPSPCQRDLVPSELLLTTQNLEAVVIFTMLDEGITKQESSKHGNRDNCVDLLYVSDQCYSAHPKCISLPFGFDTVI